MRKREFVIEDICSLQPEIKTGTLITRLFSLFVFFQRTIYRNRLGLFDFDSVAAGTVAFSLVNHAEPRTDRRFFFFVTQRCPMSVRPVLAVGPNVISDRCFFFFGWC